LPHTRLLYRNRLLVSLSTPDLALLHPQLERVVMPLRYSLEKPNTRIEHVYFVEEGIASVVAFGTGERHIEIGLIGPEGMSGISILMNDHRSPNAVYMQIAGHGFRIKTSEFKKAIAASDTLYSHFLHYTQYFMIQTSQTAVANGHAKLDQRLARWLLMAHDRIGQNSLSLTHEFLAIMLCVRRPGVTDALNDLESEKLIQASRGKITILDRKGLERRAGKTYGMPEAEYRRLIG
jgi:CRP-like cAMP-binding protein